MDKQNKNEKESEDKNKNITQKKCFIITPIGDNNSPIRRKTDGLISSVIEPVCSSLDYEVIVAYKIDSSGSITSQVIKHILEDEMVVANLTGLNPNVMYELAVRHATKKPVICLTENIKELPFDISTERTIGYCDDMLGVEILKEELKRKIKVAEGKECDNPIYRVLTESTILKEIKESNAPEGKTFQYIIERLDKIDNKINISSSTDTGYINSSRLSEFAIKFKENTPTNEYAKILEYLNSIESINIEHRNNIVNFAYIIPEDQINSFMKYIYKTSEYIKSVVSLK